MNQKTAERYLKIVDDYIGVIVDMEPDKSKKVKLISYFFPESEGEVHELDKVWLLQQFDRILKLLEEKEYYEICSTVVKYMLKLKTLKD